jgi:hypothetical protein
MCAFDAAFADWLAIDIERRGAALAETAAVVGELHPHLVAAGRQLPGRCHVEVLEARKV